MKASKHIFLFIFSAMLFACSSEKEAEKDPLVEKRAARIAEIKKWERSMKNSKELDPVIADSAVWAYSEFVSAFPEDSLCGAFVFKSAEILTARGKYESALEKYKMIENKYDRFKLYPEALFQQASLLDNYLGRDGAARMIYEKVIDRFPKSTLAADARAAILNLGKTDEQLIKEFEEKNGSKK
jgi:tetratricopeptide (TPR) repeat protein